MKRCPFCAEEIQDNAIKCRYCMESIEVDAAPAELSQESILPTIEIDDRPISVFWTILFAVVAGSIFIGLFSMWANKSEPIPGASVSQPTSEQPSTYIPLPSGVRAALAAPSTASEVAQMSAIQQMQIAFEGNWSQADIQKRIDQAMTLYNAPRTEENYSRAASCLIAFRKDTGFSEMQILDYMIRSHVPGINLRFPEGAALSVTFLQAGDR